jgi:YD repeat-containing protein
VIWFADYRVSGQSEDPGGIAAAEKEYLLGTVAPGSNFTNLDALKMLSDEYVGWGGEEWDLPSGKSALGFELNIGPGMKPAPFITSDYYQVLPTGGPEATYELANQPSYSVQLGPVNFQYKGARIWLTESLPTDSSCFPIATSLGAFSGWVSEVVKRSDESIDQRMTLARGYLTQHVVMAGNQLVTCNVPGEENPQPRCNANYVYRFSYHPAGGGRVIDFYQKPIEQLVLSQYNGTDPFNVCASFQIGALPPRYWSTDGSAWLDMRDEAKPVIYSSDGSIEELAPAIPSDFPGPGARGCVAAPPHMSPGGSPSGPLRTIDRNGNVSTYTISADGLTETLTDSRGRQTILTFVNGASFKKLVSVKVPAPAGNSAGFLLYGVTWQALPVDIRSSFPEIMCGAVQCGGSGTIDVVSSIQVPDGRSYDFQYGPFGNLTQVTEPGGAVRTYTYGDQTNTAYATNSIPLTTRPLRTLDGCAIWTGQEVNLQKRGVKSETVFPLGQGAGNPAYATSTAYERSVLPSAGTDLQTGASTTVTSRNDQVICDSQVWRVVTMPDLSVHKQGYCTNAFPSLARGASGPISSHEWELGTEVWTPGQGALVSATYSGNKNTGELFYDFDTITAFSILSPPAADRRLNRTVSIRDGVTSATTFSYGDVIDIDHSSSVVSRNTKNVTSQSTWTCTDLSSCLAGQFATKLIQADTNYFHAPPYFDPTQKNPSALSRNILHLPQSLTVTDPARGLLTRTDYSYDEFALASSFAANLITDPNMIGPARGNLTSQTSYKQPSTPAGAVSAHNHYFDTGDVQQKIDSNGNAITMNYDFGVCSPGHTMLTSTVTNAKGHQATTVNDCFTGATLRVTDPNNQSVYTQYDALGRAVETAGPGDTLTPLAGFTRDPSAPLNGGSVVGNNGQGPTTWNEYFRFGLEVFNINQQRTVAHAKDGSADGRYVKTFLDGLGRPTQTRSEVDPATSSGNLEDVATTEYDSMGRVSKAYVPVFSSASNAYVAPAPGALATITGYDALGRITSLQLPGLPATTTMYGNSGALFLTTAIDANGNQTLTLTDVLGRTVQISRQSDTCSDPALGNWCVTTMDYDAAGRLLQTTDPANNHVSFIYDGLGRKKSMTDPDMGTWTYEYDDNGNLITQTDAKLQIIKMYYDVLNRITRKDLPPNDPLNAGPEDTTYFYDGEGPAP